MRKAFVLLALLLAALSSIADQHVVSYGGYRIGDSIVATDQTRIAGLPARVENSNPTRPELTETNLTASTVIGQKLVRWWAYSSASYVPPSQAIVNGSIVITPASTNYNGKTTIATGGYSLTWTYNTVGYSPAYLVVDYDYIKYNLSYNANGGSGAPSGRNNIVYTNKVSIASGNGVSRTGYTFSGWTNDLTTTVWNDGDTVTGSDLGLNSIVDGSDVVLRAKWTANDYTVKFDANGGIGSMPDQSFTYGTGGPLTSNAFVRAGYTFNGWATSSEGSKRYDDGQTVSNLTSENGGEVTLYAKWSLVYYSLTISTTGTGSGTVSASPSGGSYTNGVVVQVTANPENGSTFTQWSDGETDNPRTYTMTSNISVSAVFAINTYKVTFKDYDDTILLSQDCNYGYAMPYPSADPLREGYIFKGWLPDPPETVKQTAVYTAQYEAKSYTVQFHSNYGNGAAESIKGQDFTYGTPQDLASVSSLKFAKDGYTFAYWKERDGDQMYEDGEQVLSLADHGVVHLDAQWTPITYTISFNGNGADSGSVGEIVATYDVACPLPANGFARVGRSFKAWRLGLDGNTYNVGDSVSNLTTTADASVTFYAVWSELRYVAFDGNGADDAGAMIDDVMTFDGIETKALVPNKFEKTGYTFAGWATNATTAVALTNCADVISTNLWMAIGETNTFFAVWQTNLYTVVFNANGGAGEMEDQTFCYDQGQTLSKCAFTSSLMFMGWATNETDSAVYADGEVVTNLTAEAGGVVHLYAVWDNGDLSKAMHCDNLVWISSGNSGTEWEAVEGSAQGYNGSGSAAKVSVAWSDTGDELYSKELSVDPLLAGSTSGKLSFWYKTGSIKSDWYSISIQNGDDLSNVELSKNWKQYGPVFVDNISSVKIKLSSSEDGDNCTLEIDQMKWVPGGAEPTDADMPTINGFTAKDGGFTLSVDGGNISDLFSYQILATNELEKGDWPVKETLTADELKAGYEIVIEENEPKMFYKVRVISK